MAVDQLTETFAALADPTRRAMLSRLAQGEATVNELAEPFPITVQAVSRHLKVLTDAGLVVRGKDAQRRPARLAGKPLAEAVQWLGSYRRFWEQSLDTLEEHLRTMDDRTTRRTTPTTRPDPAPGRGARS